MDRKATILSELEQAAEGLSPARLAERLGISRQAVARHLKELLAAGAVSRAGKTRSVRYRIAAGQPLVAERLLPPYPDEDRLFRDRFAGALSGLPPNVFDLCHYVFTEMLNNAIDHAGATQITVELADQPDTLQFSVADDGVGCFENVRRKAGLASHAEAIAHLSKGKQTTAPQQHSGEGIFFSSKAVDVFILQSNGWRWQVDNLREDVGLGQSEVEVGTRVTWKLSRDSRRELTALFAAYAVEDAAFDRTRIHIKLFERGDAFISRAEAKRLVTGLAGFKEIILDYQGVRIIGQGFADQVYRVYQRANPDKRLISINASEPVALMIRRAGGALL